MHCNLRLGARAVSLAVVGEMKNQLPVPENGTLKRPEQSAGTVNSQIPSSRGFWALIVTQFQGALFVCNHVSFVDGPLLMASTDRSLRFLIEKSYYELRWLNPFARILGLIPVSPTQSPRELIGSLRMASDAIRAGHVVCIFAEGSITRTGELLEFRRGFEHIMKNVDAPIVPIALVGVWGSIFSFEGGHFFWKWPRKFPYPVTVRFGKPLPPNATADETRAAVDELING